MTDLRHYFEAQIDLEDRIPFIAVIDYHPQQGMTWTNCPLNYERLSDTSIRLFADLTIREGTILEIADGEHPPYIAHVENAKLVTIGPTYEVDTMKSVCNKLLSRKHEELDEARATADETITTLRKQNADLKREVTILKAPAPPVAEPEASDSTDRPDRPASGTDNPGLMKERENLFAERRTLIAKLSHMDSPATPDFPEEEINALRKIITDLDDRIEAIGKELNLEPLKAEERIKIETRPLT